MYVSYGQNCKDNKTPLERIHIEELYRRISSGADHNLVDFTKNLRSVIKYSQERYRAMKTSLPFFSCSNFEPAMRSIQNFQESEGLILDIDLKSPVTESLILAFKGDVRIVLGYISPSNLGIKLVFAFDKTVKDATLYTKAYKYFSYQFGTQYHITDAIDQKNCDVSRISFLCHDTGAWYNPEFIHLNWEEFVAETPMTQTSEIKDTSDNINQTAYRQILALLDSKPKPKKHIIPIIPEITDILPGIHEALATYDIMVKETESIQYGAKIKVYTRGKQGELNVYAGKNGYKVVTSPRKGTDNELNEVARHIIESILVKY